MTNTVFFSTLSFSFFALFVAGHATAAPSKGKAEPASVPNELVYNVDPAASQLHWEARKVSGAHHGHLNFKNGELKVKNGQVTGGQFEVDMSSLVDEDLTDKEWNDKLVNHLKSDDFFSVAKHPTSRLVITEMKAMRQAGGADNANATEIKSEMKGEMRGTLVIKGISKPIRFPATVKIDGDKAELKGTATIDRTQYDIRFRSGKFYENLGDKLIYDEFKLDANLVAKRASPKEIH
jgi:polyisoprenoid-binding protein YceI